ncbi:response regulator transcription factor [Saxibacter everestensis]|uniref:Response regulator transcription factor n=1 Tax=Saxibacter everestensis TaxID=2909229 RepID=A0ABY8QRP5_9MICO|nr:response regulator transcription factor [Brevibacteriaceae bacterium ZFBP1038]
MTISVVIADDQAMVRAGFAALLAAQDDIEVLGQAANGEEAVRISRQTRPDVVLMDIRMPVRDGLAATRLLLEPSPAVAHHPRVLMLTTFDVDDYVYDALRAGASGFLLKDAPPADLVSAVRVIASGEALLAPTVTRRLIEQFAQTPRSNRSSSPGALRLGELTEREREVLTLVARGKSNSEIAGDLFIAEQTAKTHVSKILGKLQVRDRVQAVVAAYDAGFVTPVSD